MAHGKYAVSHKAMEIYKKEGYVALQITNNMEEIKTWEIAKVIDNKLPKGANQILDSNQVKRYGNIILIDKEG